MASLNLPVDSEEDRKYRETAALSGKGLILNDPRLRRKCPVCNQNVYIFRINHEEQCLMCESLECCYPFGYVPVQIVHNESDLHEKPVQITPDFIIYPRAGETNKPSHVGDDVNLSKGEKLTKRLTKKRSERNIKEQKKKTREADLVAIKGLTEELCKIEEESELCHNKIKDQNLLKNLKALEVDSGKKMLMDEEEQELMKKAPNTLGKQIVMSIELSNEGGETPSANIQILDQVKAKVV